jgi:pimeloyl-ACP methyl ester carboxylesterase
MPKPTIVLGHGAWADGASWNAVSTELQGQGFTVLIPPNLLHGVAGDAAYVASFLTQRTTGPVVLVGHSYGGVVITNAGTAGGDVRALVYVDAFIPEVGETTFQILGGSGSAFDVPDPTAVFDIVGYPGAPEGDAEAFLKPSTVHESFAQDLPRGGPVADRRKPASDHARRQHRANADHGLEDHPELDRDRNRGPRHTPGHATQHGGTGGLDDHRSRGIARIDGVPTRGCDRRHPRCRCCRRRLTGSGRPSERFRSWMRGLS